jgi:HD-like signal output (HDOD) protein
MTVQAETILNRLESIETLPTLPVVVQQINTLMARQANMSQIATVIARDQAIAGRVIRLVNSAFFGLRGRVSSIQQAIVMLGLNTVRNIVTGVAIVKTFRESGGPTGFDHEQFWLHCFASAMGAKAIAVRLGKDEPEDFFLAGLLHDSGILVLDQFFHDAFMETIQCAHEESLASFEAEKKILGITHCDVGAFLLKRWKVPESLIHAARFHHEPRFSNAELAPWLDIICAVHLSDSQASRAGLAMHHNAAPQTPLYGALRRFGLTERDVADAFVEIRREAGNLLREWAL